MKDKWGLEKNRGSSREKKLKSFTKLWYFSFKKTLGVNRLVLVNIESVHRSKVR